MKLTIALLLATTAFAGPPMICHPFVIGNEISLPWGTDKTNWNNPDPRYDTASLAADTIKLLDAGKPLIVRMETLRRAAIYSMKSPVAGLELSNQLIARALSSEVKGQSNSSALFDAGYFAESMKQTVHRSQAQAFLTIDGYDWVKRSLPGLADKPTGEYALSLMIKWPNDHFKRATAGAKQGTLLSENLKKHSEQRP